MSGYKFLFDALEVKTVLTAGPPYLPIVNTIEKEFKLRLLSVASTAELIHNEYPYFAYNKQFASASDEPLLVLHTSGTTALPKPIIITHDWVSSWVQALRQEAPPGTESLDALYQGNRVLVMMPPFHAGNLMPTLFDAVHNQSTVIFPLPDGILSPDHFQEHFISCAKGARPDIALVPAGFIHSIAKDPELLDVAAEYLEYMFYTGGDVADTDGDKVAQRVKLFNVNGSTELASYAVLRPSGKWDRSLWKYILPHPNAGIDFRRHSSDDWDVQYAAVIVRNPDLRDIQPVFSVFPDRQEYDSGDLFSPHPRIPGLWKYRGRADDCFVLMSGSNIHPLSMESYVGAHPVVKGTLMLGQRRPRPALLVELEDKILAEGVSVIEDESQRLALIEKIWPAVERGNQEYYEMSQVAKDRIIFTASDRPMQRTPKGTIKRGLTLDIYQVEVNQLYGNN